MTQTQARRNTFEHLFISGPKENNVRLCKRIEAWVIGLDSPDSFSSFLYQSLRKLVRLSNSYNNLAITMMSNQMGVMGRLTKYTQKSIIYGRPIMIRRMIIPPAQITYEHYNIVLDKKSNLSDIPWKKLPIRIDWNLRHFEDFFFGSRVSVNIFESRKENVQVSS